MLQGVEAEIGQLGNFLARRPHPEDPARIPRALLNREQLVRESAVAALGSIGHVSSANVIIAACSDKPAIRRRAVLALAAFAGPEIDAALAKALTDPDWQVRQAAEDLTGYDNDDNTAGDDRD